jgi:hypothetical protein
MMLFTLETKYEKKYPDHKMAEASLVSADAKAEFLNHAARHRRFDSGGR